MTGKIIHYPDTFYTEPIRLETYMAAVKKIFVESLGNPALRLYTSLKGRPFPYAEKYFVAEGAKLVRRLLESECKIESIFLTPEWFARYERIIVSRSEAEITVYVAEETLMQSIVGIKMHNNILAVAFVPDQFTDERILSKQPSHRLIVALDGIADAENMGGIVRNCAAFGVDLLIIGETCCSPYLRRAARVSMGGIFIVPMLKVGNLSLTLSTLTETKIFATHFNDASKDLSTVAFPENVCLVFGSEADGISSDVLSVCHERVWIRTAQGVDSLNVASASAVVLYEVRRGRLV